MAAPIRAPQTTDCPVVTAEAQTVLIEYESAAYRCSADAAHALSDSLFRAAVMVERRMMDAEKGPRLKG